MRFIRGLIAVAFLSLFAFLIFINVYAVYKAVDRGEPVFSEIRDEKAIAAKRAREEAIKAEEVAKKKAEQEARDAEQLAAAKAKCVDEIKDGDRYKLTSSHGEMIYKRDGELNIFYPSSKDIIRNGLDGFYYTSMYGDIMYNEIRPYVSFTRFKRYTLDEDFPEIKPDNVFLINFEVEEFKLSGKNLRPSGSSQGRVRVKTEGTETFKYGYMGACEIEVIRGKVSITGYKDRSFLYSLKLKIVVDGEKFMVIDTMTMKDVPVKVTGIEILKPTK